MVTPNIIDIEASGFGSHSYPIEVGLILSSGDKYCCLIKPVSVWQHWSEEAESLHHISRQVLYEYGRDVQQVCAELNQLLAGQTIYSDGWVVDYPWLIRLFQAAATPMLFSVSPLEVILKEYQMDCWQLVKDRVCTEMNCKRHRASSDAELVQRVYVQTQSNRNMPKGQLSIGSTP